MNNTLITAALLTVTLSATSKVFAQTVQYETEVCVNVSDLAEAKRRFPNARFHVFPDFADSRMNGWRLFTGIVRPDGKIMTDAEEIKLRQREAQSRKDESVKTELGYLFFFVMVISFFLCIASRRRKPPRE